VTDAALSPEEQLIDDIASFTHDPLGYALYAFPWGEDGTELAHATGPRQWQADAFREIGEHLQNPATRHQPLMISRASGHGIGKSAFISMLINWAMSTCEDCKVVVTANTDNQLRTKTWPEIIKWSNLAITKEWFTCTATAMYSNDPGHDKRWRADAIPGLSTTPRRLPACTTSVSASSWYSTKHPTSRIWSGRLPRVR
jgi:hypothetical protein